MKDLVAGFDADEVEPQGDFDPIPAGWYRAFISEHETKETKAGTGKFLELVWEVSDGEHENRKVWDRLNLDNPNETAVEIARASLSAICRAVGVAKPESADDLVGKEVEIKVAIQPAKGEYSASNIVKGYRPKGEGEKKGKGEDPLPF